ncbi:collagen-like protein [Bacillus sp. FSL K6-0268]|uniref:collagen-like protein n=1 Tax=Bacillus sp. FSL K6-0268 TaxID=2921449 RepID=UPI0030F69633
MVNTKEALKAVFVTGYTPKQQDFTDLIDVAGAQGPKGDKGDKGETGVAGAEGADGKNGTNGTGVKSISLTVDGTGKVTGGIWIGTDDKSNSITINS